MHTASIIRGRTTMTEKNSPTGHPMHEIAEQLKASAKPQKGQPLTETIVSDSADASHGNSSLAWDPLSLTPNQIEAPAFFVDVHLNVPWIAPGSTDALSNALAMELNSGTAPNIFSLLLRPAIKDALADWQALFSFVYVTLRRSTSRDIFESATDFISENQRPHRENDTVPGLKRHLFQVDSHILGRDAAGKHSPLRAFGLAFAGGTLFLLRRDQWNIPTAVSEESQPSQTAMHRTDYNTSLCMLSIRLNDSQRIADTMLPEVYFNMMNLIWDEIDGIATALGGRRAGGSGAQIQHVFKAQAGRNPVFSAICCATRLNDHMHALEKKLAAEQGWADEICMNMGISHGTGDLSTSLPDGSMAFMIPGGAFDQATLLSAVAAKNETWITKNAVAQLPKKLIDQVVLGVDRQGQFRRNFFTRIGDLPQDNLPNQPQPDIGALSIARILKIEKQ